MVQIYFNYEYLSFDGDKESERQKLEEAIMYPSDQFSPTITLVRNENQNNERLIEISFCPFGTGYYFPPGYGSKHERIMLPIMVLNSRASIACASYHELYHSDQYQRGLFPKSLKIEDPEVKKIIAGLEVDAYSKTIDYALGLEDGMWKDEFEEPRLLETFRERIKDHSY